jgi:hypothetical protein
VSMSQTLRRFALPLLAAALLVVGIFAFSSAASAAEVCTNTPYIVWGAGFDASYSVAHDEAFWDAIGDVEAAHPECEMASATVLEEIVGLVCPYGGSCQQAVHLRVRYVCRVCTGW